MHFQALGAEQSGLYSKLILDYLTEKQELSPFISFWPNEAGFAEQIEVRKKSAVDRKNLVACLRNQYGNLELGDAVSANLDSLLRDTTFTLTTGQQIHIFLGPMYVYWKIVSTISLAHRLRKQYPDLNFVPVFWMATEDHDFAEVNHCELFNRSFVWEDQQTHAGPVGRLSTEGLPELTDDLASLFSRQEEWKTFENQFRAAYAEESNFAKATRRLVHEFFKDHGLVILDPDDAQLKKDFLPIIKEELLQESSKDAVQVTSEKLGESYGLQVHPREINLFYSGEKGRERIVIKEGMLQTISGVPLGEASAIDTWLEAKVGDISANVVLRPVYQEVILPNLAYIGGPGELAYWLQLKGVFDHFSVPFPILENRKSVFIIGNKVQSVLEKMNLRLDDLFLDEDELRVKALEVSSDGLVSLKDDLDELLELKDRIIGKAASIQASQAKPLAEIFNQSEKIIKKIDKEIFTLQEAGLEKSLEKVLKMKSLIKEKGFTQERNQYIVQYLLQLNSSQIIENLSAGYQDLGPVILLID